MYGNINHYLFLDILSCLYRSRFPAKILHVFITRRAESPSLFLDILCCLYRSRFPAKILHVFITRRAESPSHPS